MVHGRVQGVFFRDSTREEARRAGVTGWVRNRPDGTVEAAFEGQRDAVERLVDHCRGGPGRATVERLEVTVEEPEGASSFEVR